MGALQQGKSRGWSWIDVFAFGAWVLLVSALTLAPQPSSTHPPPSLCILCGAPDWGEVAANILLFVPAGILFTRRGMSFVVSVAIGFALSATIEYAQLWVPGRYSALRDVAANAVGVAIGALLCRGGFWQTRATFTAAMAMPLVMVAYTGWIYAPIEGNAARYEIRVPAQPPSPNWDAEFIDVLAGGQRMATGQFPESDAMREARTAGDPLAMRFAPKSPKSYPTAYVTISDSAVGTVLDISAVGRHVFVRQSVRGVEVRPSATFLRFSGFLSGVSGTDTMILSVRAPGKGPVCAQLSVQNQQISSGKSTILNTACAARPALGAGWRLVLPMYAASHRVKRAVDGLILALSLLPVALFARLQKRGHPAAFVIATALAAAVVGHLQGLAWLGPPEVVTVLALSGLAALRLRVQPSAAKAEAET